MINFYHYYSISGLPLVAVNTFCSIFLSFSMHFEICQFSTKNEYGRFRLLKHSLVINSHPNYSDIITYFKSCHGISVSVGINAKCR